MCRFYRLKQPIDFANHSSLERLENRAHEMRFEVHSSVSGGKRAETSLPWRNYTPGSGQGGDAPSALLATGT